MVFSGDYTVDELMRRGASIELGVGMEEYYSELSSVLKSSCLRNYHSGAKTSKTRSEFESSSD